MKRTLALSLSLAVSASPAAASPVVVELFTSQGCSSCPDADKLVSTWGKAGFESGALLPLTFDVDYWNYLGWTDVFSKPAWSERQARYAQALGERTYTPQMVVAGRRAFVGSDAARAAAAAKEFSAVPPKARLALASTASPRARLDISAAPLGKEAAGLHLMLALFENDLVTHVKSGENAGSFLRNDFVVRKLEDLGALPADKPLRRRLDEAWDAAWEKSKSGAVIFLQDPATLAVYDAQTVYPLK